MGKEIDLKLEEKENKLSKEEKEKLRRKKRKDKQKQKKKQKKSAAFAVDKNDEDDEATYNNHDAKGGSSPKENKEEQGLEVEYVERDEYLLTGRYYEEFKSVFQYFSAPKKVERRREVESDDEGGLEGEGNNLEQSLKKMEKAQKGLDENEEKKPLSRKKRKMLKRMKVAQLKALVKRPDVVEAWDVTAPDPLLLVQLKSYRNSVAVPRHWCQKRKFLQNKRGILKAAFKLPEFIEATGIARLRDPFNERDGGKMVKQKLKEKMNPKMGKIDIDYEVLHDAFFKHQSKSKMTTHGDIYYEGKEDEVKMRSYKPGKLSEELRQALGISEFTPPPWIINMQRYGPPPSYPNLKIAGLNAVMSDSNPLIDRALYGKGFEEDTQAISNTLWGEYVEEEEEENIEEPEGANADDGAAPDSKADAEGKSGTTSIISGMETPEIDIRKQPSSFGVVKAANPHDLSDKPLYQILEPVQKNIGANIFGSSHGYVIPGVNDHGGKANEEGEKKGKNEDRKGDKSYRF